MVAGLAPAAAVAEESLLAALVQLIDRIPVPPTAAPGARPAGGVSGPPVPEGADDHGWSSA